MNGSPLIMKIILSLWPFIKEVVIQGAKTKNEKRLRNLVLLLILIIITMLSVSVDIDKLLGLSPEDPPVVDSSPQTQGSCISQELYNEMVVGLSKEASLHITAYHEAKEKVSVLEARVTELELEVFKLSFINDNLEHQTVTDVPAQRTTGDRSPSDNANRRLRDMANAFVKN